MLDSVRETTLHAPYVINLKGLFPLVYKQTIQPLFQIKAQRQFFHEDKNLIIGSLTKTIPMKTLE